MKKEGSGASRSDGFTALHQAAGLDAVREIKALVTGGAKVDGVDALGRTPLYMAVDSGAFGALSSLLKYGANLDTCDRDGKTPLHRAAEIGDTEMVVALLKAGADPSLVDSKGQTAERLARAERKAKIAELIRNVAQDCPRRQ